MSYHFLDFELDPSRYQLRRAGAELKLPPRIFDLILLLVRHRDRPVPKREILATIWHGRTVTEASLTHAIAAARKALGDTPSAQSIIKTVHGRGYWWVAETREDESLGPKPRAPFVGREHELGLLRTALNEAQRRWGGLVLIVGEPGAGKTRLVDHFSSDAEKSGALVVKVCAEDLQPTPPFYLWRRVGRQLNRLTSSDLPGPIARLLAEDSDSEGLPRAFGLDAESSLESAAARVALCDSIATLLAHVTSKRPLVLVLEDVHRADGASLQALIHVMPFLSREMVLVVATQRPAPMIEERLRGDLARIARMERTSTILIPPLTKQEVLRFLVELADPRIPTTSAALVFDASAGNPFLLWQIVAIARLRAGVRDHADLTNLPTAARAAIALHVAELSPESIDAIRVASVVGLSFDLSVLARVLDWPLSRVGRVLASVEQVGLIRPARAGGYEFVHALLREALYEEIDPHVRSQLHLEAGEAMNERLGANLGDQLPAIAAHFREARMVGGYERAVALSERCGLMALRRLAFHDGAKYLADALTLVREDSRGDASLELRLLLALGSARMCAGDRVGARMALVESARLAAARGMSDSVAEAALRMAPSVLSLESGVVDHVLIDLLEQALVEVDDDALAVKSELSGRLAMALYWSDEYERRAELIRDLRASRYDDNESRRRAFLFALGAAWSPDSLEDRISVLEQLRRERRESLGPLEVVARIFRVSTLLETGDLDGISRECARLESELAARGEPYGTWYPDMFKACRALSRGEFDEAVALANRYAEVGGRFGDANVIHAFAAQVGESLWIRGGAGVAVDGVEKLAEQHPSMTEWRAVSIFFRTLSDASFCAEDHIERLSRNGFSGMRRTPSWTVGMCCLVEAVVRRNLRRWAEPLFEALAPYKSRNAVAGFGVLSWGSMCRYLGQLARVMDRLDEAENLIRAAIHSDSLAGAPAWVVRSECALAQLLLRHPRRGRRSEGLEVARRVEAAARERGMMQIVSDIDRARLSC